MRVTTYMFVPNELGQMELRNFGGLVPNLPDGVSIAIDGSTTCSGVAYILNSNGAILGCSELEREDGTEDYVRYKVQFKKFLNELLTVQADKVTHIFYEEPILGSFTTSSALLALRTSVKELKVENEPKYDKIDYCEVNNKHWKKLWLYPSPVPNGSDLEKKAVRDKLVSLVPYLQYVKQDSIDAICMGIVSVNSVRSNGSTEGVKTKKKAKPFKYEIKFIGILADDKESADVAVIDELRDSLDSKEFRIPKSVLENGIRLVDLNGHGLFDKHVYSEMEDDDMLLILGFDSDKYYNVLLEHNVVRLASNCNRMYAVIWRKTRKK